LVQVTVTHIIYTPCTLCARVR